MYTSHERLYLNADKTEVVKEGDPAARYLLVGEGGEISDDEAKRYGLMGKPKDAAADEKAQAPAANKARAKGEDK